MKYQQKTGNLKDNLPVIVTTNEGVPIVTTPNKLGGKDSNIVEMRTSKTTRSNRRFEDVMRRTANRPAADRIEFVQQGKEFKL